MAKKRRKAKGGTFPHSIFVRMEGVESGEEFPAAYLSTFEATYDDGEPTQIGVYELSRKQRMRKVVQGA